MKKILITLLFAAQCLYSLSQGIPETKIEDLRTPSSPGFMLLDEAPASIEKPSTPTGFALSLLNLRTGGALEVAPYWLKDHPDLDYETHVNSKFPFVRTLSLSISTINRNDTMNLAGGVRFQLLRLRSKKALGVIKSKYDSLDPNLPLSPKVDYAGILKRLNASIDRPTFLVEVALAYSGSSAGASFENLQRSRLGAWITMSLTPRSDKPWEFILLNRYIENPKFSGYDPDTKLNDLGFKAMYFWEEFSFSLEYIGRMNLSKSGYEYRYDGLIEYRLSDNIYATATLGRNFDSQRDIIALFGVNLGLHSESKISH